MSAALFVGNVSQETTDSALQEALRAACPAGPAPAHFFRPCHVRNGKPRPFAFAHYRSSADRAAALEQLSSAPVTVDDHVLHFRASKGRRDGSDPSSESARAQSLNSSRDARYSCPKCGTSIRVCRKQRHSYVCPARNQGTQTWYKKDVNLNLEKDKEVVENDNREDRGEGGATRPTANLLGSKRQPRAFFTKEELESIREALQRAEIQLKMNLACSSINNSAQMGRRNGVTTKTKVFHRWTCCHSLLKLCSIYPR